jgi:hypothetical protein
MLAPDRCPSQLSGRTPFRIFQRIRLMAPMINNLRMSNCPILLTPLCRVLPPPDRYQGTRPSPGGEVSTVAEGAQIRRNGHHRAGRHRFDVRHCSQTTHLVALLRCVWQLTGQFFKLFGEQVDRVQAERIVLQRRFDHRLSAVDAHPEVDRIPTDADREIASSRTNHPRRFPTCPQCHISSPMPCRPSIAATRHKD